MPLASGIISGLISLYDGAGAEQMTDCLITGQKLPLGYTRVGISDGWTISATCVTSYSFILYVFRDDIVSSGPNIRYIMLRSMFH